MCIAYQSSSEDDERFAWYVVFVAVIFNADDIDPPASMQEPASFALQPVELFPPPPPPPPPPVLVLVIQTCMVYCPDPENCSTLTYTLVPPTLVPFEVTSS